MEVLRHKNIIKFVESAETNVSYQYIMEYFEGDDLFNYVDKNP